MFSLNYLSDLLIICQTLHKLPRLLPQFLRKPQHMHNHFHLQLLHHWLLLPPHNQIQPRRMKRKRKNKDWKKFYIIYVLRDTRSFFYRNGFNRPNAIALTFFFTIWSFSTPISPKLYAAISTIIQVASCFILGKSYYWFIYGV